MERRPEPEQEFVFVLLLCRGLVRQVPQMGGRAMVGFGEGVVEAANAAEPGGQCNVPHGQGSLVDQLLCEVQPTRLRDRDRARSEMLQKQTAQVSSADAKPLCKWFHSPV